MNDLGEYLKRGLVLANMEMSIDMLKRMVELGHEAQSVLDSIAGADVMVTLRDSPAPAPVHVEREAGDVYEEEGVWYIRTPEFPRGRMGPYKTAAQAYEHRVEYELWTDEMEGQK